MTKLNLNVLSRGFWMVLLLNTFSTVAGEDYIIAPWELLFPSESYPSMNVTVGDTLTFFWPDNETQSVFINPSGTCNDFNSILVGNDVPAEYTFVESDAVRSAQGFPLFFADNIGSNCEWGMRFRVFVTSNTVSPTLNPTGSPTVPATPAPTSSPTLVPTGTPTLSPTSVPTATPTLVPSNSPSATGSSAPTRATPSPSNAPSTTPTMTISGVPSASPSAQPTVAPSGVPSTAPSPSPSAQPTDSPSVSPSTPKPSASPTITPTTPPVPFPTEPPTFKPTADPTANPTQVPSISPTIAPTKKDTEAPTRNPTEAPVPIGERVSETFTGLKMGMAGITELTPDAIVSWQTLTEEYSTSFVFNSLKDSVTNFVTTYEITDFAPYEQRRMMRGESRDLQDQEDIIVVEYTQIVKYNVVGSTAAITAEELVGAPFATDSERAAYVTVLKTSEDPVLSGVKGVSEVQIPLEPTPTPDPPPTKGLSNAAIIGISCGGAGLLIVIVLFWIYCRSGASEGEEKEGDPPLHVDVRNDEVSTLAGPDGPPTYGDQSVATVDYDYSKAYGGAGDTSVSSAGGTFGSQTQNISLPANAAATGAALGSMDSSSYDDTYGSPRSSAGNEEVIHIFAPPGKLGVVIDTPDDGAPVVHAVKDTSVIADRIIVGDKLVAVDDEDVRSMTAIKVSKMISRKGANPSRKLTIVRTVPIEE